MARLAVATTARSRRNRVVGLAWPLHGVDAMTMDEFWALIEVARTNHDTYLQRLKALSQEALVDLYWTYEETAAELRGDRHALADADAQASPARSASTRRHRAGASSRAAASSGCAPRSSPAGGPGRWRRR
jgi:hypothetical protein